jgi:hypothetical protein
VLERDEARSDQEPEEEEDEIPFNWWIDTNPEIKKRIAKAAKASKKEGELEDARQVVLKVVQAHFPTQLSLAQQRVNTLTRPEQLHRLLLAIVATKDETTVIQLLIDDQQRKSTKRKN